MANPKHLKILKQGIPIWNKWVDKNDIKPDLSHADLRGIRLVRANLDGANLRGAKLEGVQLNGAGLDEAILTNANLQGADLTPATDESRGSGVMHYTILAGADLQKANLSRAFLTNANFEGANLTGAIFCEAYMPNADFREANLSYADFAGAVMTEAHLKKTNLRGTRLVRANLMGAKIEDACFTTTHMGWTILGDTDLSSARDLNSVIHFAPSIIDISTIYRSKGNIPESFLKKAGFPDEFLLYMHSLTNQAIRFYSCFISFTESDDLFSERLYNDMQAAGVRCWRWKEDAKWGSTLMRSIDEAVHVYDKLVVICSEASLNSPAVIREIERALQKEDDLARQSKYSEVLFPIRLDDYIFTGWNHHRKADVILKNIGDFRQWKEPESYRKSLARLVCDLKA